MPIHLPPLSRRQFLARTLAAGAGLALAPGCATNRPTDNNSYALLSDIHIPADRKTSARGINMADHLETVSAEVIALPKKPACVFINGDCAYNRGEMADYATMTTLLAPMRANGLTVHLALGNHDNRERFWAALVTESTLRRPLADRQVALISEPLVNWIILDSLETTLSTPGLLGQQQLEWLAKALDANPDKPAIIMVHHNPGTIRSVGGIKDTDALYAVIRPRKQVKALIFGHTHYWSIEQDSSGLHLINLPPVAYVFHEGDPAGWVLATVSPHGLTLSFSCLDKAHAAHAKVRELEWRSA